MADFLRNKAKWILMAYGIVLFVVLLFGIIYTTQYAHIHIAYNLVNGKATYSEESMIGSFASNMDLFQYFNSATDSTSPVLQGLTRTATTVVDSGYADLIYKFQTTISSYTTMFLIFNLISLICFAVMLIFSNQSRKVYYKDNLVVGILMPFVVIILGIILLVGNFSNMALFNENADLYKVTALYMNPDIGAVIKQRGMQEGGFENFILQNTADVNSAMFVIAIFVIIILIAVSALMMIYTVYRYKECAKRRNDIIERAANNND